MRNTLIPFGLCILISGVFSNLCSAPCSCIDRTVDCSNLKLKTQFNKTEWDGMQLITEAKFDVNQIRHLTQYPKLPLVYLSLTHNMISTIDDGAFSNLESLTILDLSHNYLDSGHLNPNIFKGQYQPEYYAPLKNLTELNLSHNLLYTLHPDVFEHLPRLERLSLNNNPFKTLDKNTVTALSSIQSLKLLDLSATDLYSLPEYPFGTPRFLSILNLSLNRFSAIPDQLEHVEALQFLFMDDNPIISIDKFPRLSKLEVLHLNWLPKLKQIGPYSLSNLTGLKELYCHNNINLKEISANALTSIPTDSSEGPVWPVLKKLDLHHNGLRYLDSNLLGRWDLLEDVNIKGNPWVCECDNQWIVEDLIPKIRALKKDHLLDGIICHEPLEMKGVSMVDLQAKHYTMRCLDKYGNQPEKDGSFLLGLIIGLWFAVPFMVAAIIVYRRRNQTPKQFSRAFYKRAESSENLADSMHY
ncbi:leucine-rich repeat-containing protein 4B isoform X2 [Nilaparvata lugens]|nr:leucine-rich repeat-containing protein 4B isoform X2 [Nilaparvata lugens]